MRLFAGWLPPSRSSDTWGRRTGREFATPVLAFRTVDGLVVGVLYGTASDCEESASGRRRAGQAARHRAPLSTAATCRSGRGLQLVPAIIRGPFRALEVLKFLRLTAVPRNEPER